MPIHSQVLNAALRLCRSRRGWWFSPIEIVRALPHLSAGSVRTHVVSRCCVNAPKNHTHKWDYFERVARGVYEVRPPFRRKTAAMRTVVEPVATYAGDVRRRDTVHAVISDSDGWYVVECLEVAVVTQGRSLDELVANLKQAIEQHLEGEDLASVGLTPTPRVALTYEFASGAP